MSEVSRRSVLRAGLVIAAAVPLGGFGLPTAAAFAASALTRSSFAPYRGTRFTLATPVGTVLTLASIEDLPNAPRGDAKRFSLIFRLAAGTRPTQGTRTMTHPKMGKLTLFLVPVGRSGDLQAVFNAR